MPQTCIDPCVLHHPKCVLYHPKWHCINLKLNCQLHNYCFLATTMDELGPLIFGSYEECLMYYARQRLLASQAHCRLCGTTMDLKKRPSVKDQFSWRCTNSSCRTWLTLRHGSFFEKSNLDLQKWLHIIFLWSADASQKQIIETTGISQKTIIDCCSFLRDI